MTRVQHFAAAALAGAVLTVAVASAEVKFTSTWAAPDAASVNFKGKKVAALVISDDLSLRMSAEEYSPLQKTCGRDS